MSLSTCGAMTGFTFAHGTVADMTSPTSVPVHLLALDEPAAPARRPRLPRLASSRDGALRPAIVSVARHYLRMAQGKTPAEMEALIWQASSIDGADHGQSCAAFASLTLALGARAVGQQSWVTGGGSYPWPLHPWADVRVQPNPASPDVTSMLQDAQAHHRWHPLGDGYRPQPGDWVLFDGHVEVLTRYSGAALYTVGADSLPNLTVNAHRFPVPFGAQGVLGFVDNGELASAGRPRPRGMAGQRWEVPRRRCPGWHPSRRGRHLAGARVRRRSRVYPACSRTPRAVRRGSTLRSTAGTISRRRADRGRPPSRPLSAWWRRGRSRRSSGTASRPR